MTRRDDLTVRFVDPREFGSKRPLNEAAVDSIKVFRRAIRDGGYGTYGTYLRSSHWRRIVATFRDRLCAICGRRDGLELHHVRYDYLGREQDHPECLVTVCGRHHQQIHGYSKRHGCTIARATTKIMRKSRQPGKRKSAFKEKRAAAGHEKEWGLEQLKRARVER